MTYHLPNLRLIAIFVAAFFVLSLTSFAEGARDRTQFGSDITIGPGEQVSDATCFGCSIRVRGSVKTDATAFGGSIIVEDGGEVHGDVADFGKGVRLDKEARVGGEVTVFGGPLRREPGATIGGQITIFNGYFWLFLIFGLPFVILGGFIALMIWIVGRVTRPSVPVAA